jgi:hypothetical protein
MKRKIMFLYGIGFRGLVFARSITKGKKFQHSLLMKPSFKLESLLLVMVLD